MGPKVLVYLVKWRVRGSRPPSNPPKHMLFDDLNFKKWRFTEARAFSLKPNRAKYGVFQYPIIKNTCFFAICISNMVILPKRAALLFLWIVKNTCFLPSWILKSVILP